MINYTPTEKELKHLWAICTDFIYEHQVTCPEDTIKDSVYEEASILTEKIGSLVGYYNFDEDD
jgi:hypothetical protein